MNLIIYFFIGIITAIIGALPLGTTNIAVINTTVKENMQTALKIVYTAALAELILVLIAINFNMQIENFIGMNPWLQYTIAIVLLSIGLILFLKRNSAANYKTSEIKKNFNLSKQMLGFILGLVNPTVLIYWILVISFLNKKLIYLDMHANYVLLILFLAGVFLGKVLTLFGYGTFSNRLKKKSNNITARFNRVIGVLLIGVSLLQFTKLFFS